MMPLVNIALFGWIPVVLGFFVFLTPRRAVLCGVLGGFLFLPNAGYEIVGLPEYTKNSAISISVLLGVCLFDSGRLIKFRPRWSDLPIIIWCICPICSALSNQVGSSLGASLYGGVSMAMDQVISWGILYLMGRLYFCDAISLREFAIAIFIAGLVYIPFCLYEIRMSPQLHRMVYGFTTFNFVDTRRLGGYRPAVFLNNGLTLGLWMTAASLVGVWLWQTKSVTRLWRQPMWVFVSALLVTTVMCRSTGALALLMLGLGVLAMTKLVRNRFALICFIAIAPLYMSVRATNLWTGEQLLDISESVVGASRARSLKTRIDNENLLVEKALQRPILGWSGWGRYQIYDWKGKQISIPDGLWVIAIGKHGLLGLISLTLVLLLPAMRLATHCSPDVLRSAVIAPAFVLSVITVLFMLDSLHNAMINPVIVMAAGSAVGLRVKKAMCPKRT